VLKNSKEDAELIIDALCDHLSEPINTKYAELHKEAWSRRSEKSTAKSN
jgi:hypothetical protein